MQDPPNNNFKFKLLTGHVSGYRWCKVIVSNFSTSRSYWPTSLSAFFDGGSAILQGVWRTTVQPQWAVRWRTAGGWLQLQRLRWLMPCAAWNQITVNHRVIGIDQILSELFYKKKNVCIRIPKIWNHICCYHQWPQVAPNQPGLNLKCCNFNVLYCLFCSAFG